MSLAGVEPMSSGGSATVSDHWAKYSFVLENRRVKVI